ncbi:MAG: 2-dehydro-3-deoxy-6-phosphogalactonate aldolase, partial [Sphingomonas sp.]|nr:2-dehydro-3-deoxy-6-phosphogalactonate aldolase [Sphingomonas sp.]
MLRAGNRRKHRLSGGRGRNCQDARLTNQFDKHFADCSLIAILRGVRPDEVEAIGDALYEGGIRIIEVPLNSPDPLGSIARLSARFEGRALIGAGTVLRVDQIDPIRAAGGRLVVSPSTNVDVIAASVAAGMVSCPGYFTPSEAFAAIDAGAHALKFFPAEGGSPAVVRAQRAVLPKDVRLIVVGGVSHDTM